MKYLLLIISSFVVLSAHANNSNLHPVAQQESNPSRSWFYDGETVVFSSSSSYDLDGYVQARKWYINGTQVSTSTNYSRCFILDGSSGSGCYQLSSGVTTVTIKLEAQDNSGDWDSETIVYEVKDYKKRKYFIKDHLGSVRTTVDIDGNVLGYDDYYPFGLQMPGRSSNSSNQNDNYKFTGYEDDDEAGLKTQHAGARRYDPVIGRFLSIDRFYDIYPSMSPYQYAANNPINFIDVNGDSVWQITKLVKLDNHHAYLLLTPDNMEDFEEGEYADLFQEYTFTDENDKKHTKMGIIVRAGPHNDDTNSYLEASTNYRDDPSKDNQTDTDLIKSNLSDTEFITSILQHHENYQERQKTEGQVPDYEVPPVLEMLGGKERLSNLKGHNSNSYVSGLIIVSQGFPINPGVKTPLYANPVHPKYFFPVKKK